MTDAMQLKTCLDALTECFGAGYIDTDPVSIVHRYTDPVDREAAGFIVSSLSYGGAAQIIRSARAALAPAGDSPASFIRSLTRASARNIWHGFKHRWTDCEDIVRLAMSLQKILNEYGSVGSLIESLDDPSEQTVEGVMIRLVSWMRDNQDDTFQKSLVPSPADGSACKRLAMYFRWMVRGPDDIDFGIWNFISPSRLVIPVDSHIARIARRLNLTKRSSSDWKMALEITAALRTLDPADPVRYDFALVRPGILGDCRSTDPDVCRACALASLCTGNMS